MSRPRDVLRLTGVFAVATLVACGALRTAELTTPSEEDAGATSEPRRPGRDASSSKADGASPADAGEPAFDAAPEFDGALGPTGLDQGVSIPDLSLVPCDRPGFSTACLGIAVACRMATPDSGRCEKCEVEQCRGLVRDACTKTEDCDVELQCFRGRCTLVCSLGTTACGTEEDCIDVGHATLGLCDPFEL